MVRPQFRRRRCSARYYAAVIGIDLDLGDVAAVGRSELRSLVMRRIKPRLQLSAVSRDRAPPFARRENIDAEVVPGTLNTPSSNTYILRRDFQKVRIELRAFVDDGASRLVYAPCPHGKRTRTARNPIVDVGVAIHHVGRCLDLA